jgi:DNA (cytosine-5)-methyltransferase 1
MARVIREVRPRHVFVENSPVLTSRGLHRVLGDLAEMGFNAQWGVLGADDVGAPHIRKRIWIMANSQQEGLERQRANSRQPEKPKSRNAGSQVADAYINRAERSEPQLSREGSRVDGCSEEGTVANAHSASIGREGWRPEGREAIKGDGWWGTEPDVGRVADGVASRVDRLKCLGNGQVPAVAATAFRLLRERGSA